MQNYLREEGNLLDVCAVDNGSKRCAGLYRGIQNTCPGGGLMLSAVVQCICRIPPEAGCDAGVHVSVRDCLAAPSAM